MATDMEKVTEMATMTAAAAESAMNMDHMAQGLTRRRSDEQRKYCTPKGGGGGGG